MKIRYVGFLANTNKKESISLIRQLINSDAEFVKQVTETVQQLTDIDLSCCPECGQYKMIYLETLPENLTDTS